MNIEKFPHRSYANLRIKLIIFEIRELAFSIEADALTKMQFSFNLFQIFQKS